MGIWRRLVGRCIAFCWRVTKLKLPTVVTVLPAPDACATFIASSARTDAVVSALDLCCIVRSRDSNEISPLG